jgi:uncharacterized membrane protein
MKKSSHNLPLSNPYLHYGIITLIIAVGVISLLTCIAMMTPHGAMMMGMPMATGK